MEGLTVKAYIVGALAGAGTTLAIVWFGMPLASAWRAESYYEQIPTWDYEARCTAATTAAAAWTAASSYDKSTKWRDQAEISCGIASLKR